MPAPFGEVSDTELHHLQDNLGSLAESGTSVIVVTCQAVSTNKKWADEIGVAVPILSDFWPHGETTRRFGVFDESTGDAQRKTFILDEYGVVFRIVHNRHDDQSRRMKDYRKALKWA